MEMIFRTAAFEAYKINHGYVIEDVKKMRKFHNSNINDLLSDVIKSLDLMECEKAFELLDEYEVYKNLNKIKK